MQGWLYKVEPVVKDAKILGEHLDVYGRDGWELVTILERGELWLVMKRPSPTRD